MVGVIYELTPRTRDRHEHHSRTEQHSRKSFRALAESLCSDFLMPAPLGSTLRIAIPGAGMAGLATALSLAQQGFEHIDVYETASNMGFVGAGIQVAPNLSRVLRHLGVWDYIKDDAVEMKEASIRGAVV